MDNKKSKTLLLVEDEEISARLSVSRLEKNGYEIIHASTGEEAIEMINSAPGINLVLMDIELGDGIDGAEAAAVILQKHNIPLIFLTSHSEPEIVSKTDGIESYGYILKNQDETVLIASIKMALNLFNGKIRRADEIGRKKNEELNKLNIELATINNIFKTLNNELTRHKESEDFYRTLFENTGSGVIVIEEDTTISLANRVFAESFGFSRKDLQNRKKWTELVDEKYIDSMLNEHYLRRKDPHKAKSNYEFSFIIGDNKERHYLLNMAMIPGTAKSIASIIDITERKNAEAALEIAEEKYRNLFMNSQIGIFRTEIDSGLVLETNDRFAQLFGFRNRDDMLMNSTCVEQFYTKKSVRKKMISFMRIHGEVRNYEVQFERKDGSIFWIRYSARLIADRGWLEGVAEEITDLKLAEEERDKIYNELLGSEKKYRLIFESSPLGFIHFDSKGIITDCNPMIEEITGAQWNEITGLNMLEDPNRGVAAAVTIALKGMSGEYEGFYKFNEHAKDKMIRVQLKAIHDENNIITGGVGIVEDITGKRAAERAILDEIEKERARIGHILHDSLGQKLGAVLYLSQAFRKKYDKTGKLSDFDMENLVSLASSALDETRTLSRGLDLPVIDIGSFFNLLSETAMRIRTVYSIDVELDISDSLKFYDKLKLTNLYYIILESINNAIKHGKAKKIILRYFNENNIGVFFIESMQRTALKHDISGMGLRIMKYRAKVAGMELNISSENKRVVVSVSLGDYSRTGEIPVEHVRII